MTPEFSSSLQDAVGMENEETKLTCCVTGYPAPDIQWLCDGTPLKPSDNVKITFDGTEATLSIVKTRKADAGTYSCKVVDNLL